jgi:hypothetical protein
MWVVEVEEGGKWVPDSVWDSQSEADHQADFLRGSGKNVRVTRK